MAKAKEDLEIKELEFDVDGLCVLDGKESQAVKAYSTGSLGLDILTGGIIPGVAQAWGPDGIGKTTMLLIMGGEFQAAHNYEFVRVYLHATEGRYNPRLCTMAPKLKMEALGDNDVKGGNPSPIFRITRPKSGEKLLDWVLKTVMQDKIKFFHIIDSVDGIESEVNEGKTMSDAEKTAATATLLTKFLKKASSYANHYGHIIAFTHQVRDKIQTGPSHVSGVGKQKAGGHAVDHYSNFRVGISKLWSDLYIYENPNDNKSKIIGHIMDMKIEKTSNSGNVHAKASVPFIYNHGVDREREIAILAEAYGLVTRKGAWYVHNDENIAQGQLKFIQYLKKEKEVANSLENDIKKMNGLTL